MSHLKIYKRMKTYKIKIMLVTNVCSSNGKYLTFMLHELLNITVLSQVTFPLYWTIAFVLMLDDRARESALLT